MNSISNGQLCLGHALNLKAVAEGVEVLAGWEALGRLGCDLVQGYYVSKPLRAPEFIAWVIERRREADRTAPAPAHGQTAPLSDRRSSSG